MTGVHRISRRSILAAGLLAPATLFEPAFALSPISTASPMRCADFLATIGVNTHLAYSDSQYNNVSQVISALGYCGLSHVRDLALNSSFPNSASYSAVAQAGATFCLFWGAGVSMAEQISQISALGAAWSGAVEALEGPNEIQPSFAYQGLTGNAAAQQFMIDMQTAAGAIPNLATMPLVSFTSYAAAASVAGYANAHPYPKNGGQPGSVIRAAQAKMVGATAPMAGKPMVFTEFGYHTLVGPPAPGQWEGVDETTQAILLLNGLFDAAAAGISRTCIYQLFDAYADGGTPSQENHFGLFRFDGTPKPSATALGNLTGILADTASDAHGFAVEPIQIGVSVSVPSSGLTLMNSSGGVFLLLWAEPTIWNSTTHSPIIPTPTQVTVTAPAAMQATAWDLLTMQQIGAPGASNVVSVNFSARPILIQMG